MMKTDKKGLYVHIPFCVKKCNYCDFCSFSGLPVNTKNSYIDQICLEILSYREKRISIDTIFFGGGTPTLLSVEDLRKITAAIRETFYIDENAEFTMEANPGTTTRDALQGFIDCGVNRFSIGLQTIHEKELKKLGRIHTYEDFLRTYTELRDLGITNINVDLMYGIPYQTMDSFEKTLSEVSKLKPEHLSVYGLILEEGTPFFDCKEDLPIPKEDTECDMYELACKILEQSGYSHYEISNYAKPGYESRHNKKYWNSQEFIGVGLSAYSYLDGKRFGNTKDLWKYLSGSGFSEYCDIIDPETEKYEYAMLALRLREGISLSEFRELFSEDFLSGREETISRLSSGGYVNINNDRLSLTEKGFYVSNYIITELL